MSTWKETLREQRRGVILEAAAKVFADKGYQRATMKEVADEAGIAPGTIYLYFDHKRDLLVSIAEELAGLMPRDLPDSISTDGERSFIQCVMRDHLRLVEKYRPFFHAIIAEMWTDDALREQYFNRVMTPILNTIELFLQIGIDTGRTREHDPRIVARAMVGTIFLFAMTAEMPPGDYLSNGHRDTLVHELTDFFLYGVKGVGEAQS